MINDYAFNLMIGTLYTLGPQQAYAPPNQVCISFQAALFHHLLKYLIFLGTSFTIITRKCIFCDLVINQISHPLAKMYVLVSSNEDPSICFCILLHEASSIGHFIICWRACWSQGLEAAGCSSPLFASA